MVYDNINTAEVKVDVGEDNTAVSMDYLIKLVKGDTEVEIRDFTARLSYPYPDRRYELRIDKNDNPFVFEFYIQGKERGFIVL